MNFRKIWDSVFAKPHKSASEKPFRSLVILLKRPPEMTTEDLRSAAERAWDCSFDGKQDPMFFVFQQGPLTIVKAGPSVMQILEGRSPYLDHTEETLKHLYKPEQKKACLEHFAWIAIDLWNGDYSRQQAYKPLAELAQQLMGPDCTGVYLPGENMLMPNDGTAEQGMWLIRRDQLFQ